MSRSTRGERAVTTAQGKAADRTPARGRALTVLLWILQVVVAGFFLMSAMGKFSNVEPAKSTFEAIGFGDWFRNLVAVLEVAGAAALFVPRLAGPAGLALAGLMVGATLTESFVSGGGVVMPLATLVLCAVIAWGRWESTTRLWAAVTRR
ncbi:DoxX family protein [Nonomuraea sp. KC401]|uniref:DoxX family protein n=1 Tax=unclassified Nonomuraea TaxID=2593643 RepID=UPI0010FEA5A4|nr:MULTISPECIES: DoxX family protein [unclassified Nonomuraea]NBE99945.1 DoxX family membrane protein [Nonomuraea sp. K271]TLF54942.1 DoxX family protein [Nonomuraea sp. KC401]